MADIFTKENAQNLLQHKFVLLLGGSNMRATYKDLILLLVKNDIGEQRLFRLRPPKLERRPKFFGDKVENSSNNTGRDYVEDREYMMNGFHLRYHFITRIFGSKIKETLRLIETKSLSTPDVIVLNSCTWDLTRWGSVPINTYKKELVELFAELKRIMPEETLIIWTSTPPIANKILKGGLLDKKVDFLKSCIRFLILEANRFTQQLCQAFELDFLDLHYHLRFQLHRRHVDGVHWDNYSIRYITCLLLTHVSLALNVALPGNVDNQYLKNTVEIANEFETVNLNELDLTEDVKRIVKLKLSARKSLVRKKPLKQRLFRIKDKKRIFLFTRRGKERILKKRRRNRKRLRRRRLACTSKKLNSVQDHRKSIFQLLNCSPRNDENSSCCFVTSSDKHKKDEIRSSVEGNNPHILLDDAKRKSLSHKKQAYAKDHRKSFLQLLKCDPSSDEASSTLEYTSDLARSLDPEFGCSYLKKYETESPDKKDTSSIMWKDIMGESNDRSVERYQFSYFRNSRNLQDSNRTEKEDRKHDFSTKHFVEDTNKSPDHEFNSHNTKLAPANKEKSDSGEESDCHGSLLQISNSTFSMNASHQRHSDGTRNGALHQNPRNRIGKETSQFLNGPKKDPKNHLKSIIGPGNGQIDILSYYKLSI